MGALVQLSYQQNGGECTNNDELLKFDGNDTAHAGYNRYALAVLALSSTLTGALQSSMAQQACKGVTFFSPMTAVEKFCTGTA
jgi:hypothetical protein